MKSNVITGELYTKILQESFIESKLNTITRTINDILLQSAMKKNGHVDLLKFSSDDIVEHFDDISKHIEISFKVLIPVEMNVYFFSFATHSNNFV